MPTAFLNGVLLQIALVSIVKIRMASLPLVSIIIPCYNGERFVAEAIESALAQTYPHKEVIVIDDGSTDNSLDVIKSFGDKIRWETGPNRGGCAARNRGIELARGELIQFLDADDILHPQKLERQVPVAVTDAPTITCCDWFSVNMDKEENPRIHKLMEGIADGVVFVLSHNQFPTESPLHWREFLVAVGGFTPGLSAAQEFDLHLRLAASGCRFRRLPEALFTVRNRQGSVSSDYVKAVRCRLEVIPRVVADLKQKGELTPERAKAFAAFLAATGRGCVQRRAYDIGLQFFAMAKKLDPGGGLDRVYSPITRSLVWVLGPILTEKLVQAKRRLFTRHM